MRSREPGGHPQSQDLVVVLQEPSHLKRLLGVQDQVAAFSRRIILVLTFDPTDKNIARLTSDPSERFMTLADRKTPLRRLSSSRVQRLYRLSAGRRATSARNGCLGRQGRRLAQRLLRLSWKTVGARQALKAWRVARRWARRRREEAEIVLALAGAHRQVLLFQNASLDLTGVVSERLGPRAVVFTEVMQMPFKRRVEFARRLPGPEITPEIAELMRDERPDWRVDDSRSPMNLAFAMALLLAEDDGGVAARPFLLNNVTQTGARVLYFEPALKREYRGYGLFTERFERVAPPALTRPTSVIDEGARVVLNPPSNYYPQQYRAWDLPDYATLIDQWVGEARRILGDDIVLSLHPGLRPSDIDACVASGAPVASAPVSALLSRAALYVSYVSTTTRIAARFGVRHVVSDCYGFLGGEWPETPSMWPSEDRASFATALAAARDAPAMAKPLGAQSGETLRTLGEALFAGTPAMEDVRA